MNRAKHTPGPWHVVPIKPARDEDNVIVIRHGDISDTENEVTCLLPMSIDNQYRMADAYLIAAAPQMLLALENLMDMLDRLGSQHWAVSQAKRVIKKAKGEA